MPKTLLSCRSPLLGWALLGLVLLPLSLEAAGNGLWAQYYDQLGFVNFKLGRTDATVNFAYGSGGSPHASVASNTFSSRWDGFVEAPCNGTYTFQTISDDGVRLWVNNVLVIDQWNDHGGHHSQFRRDRADRGGAGAPSARALRELWRCPHRAALAVRLRGQSGDPAGPALLDPHQHALAHGHPDHRAHGLPAERRLRRRELSSVLERGGYQ